VTKHFLQSHFLYTRKCKLRLWIKKKKIGGYHSIRIIFQWNFITF